MGDSMHMDTAAVEQIATTLTQIAERAHTAFTTFSTGPAKNPSSDDSLPDATSKGNYSKDFRTFSDDLKREFERLTALAHNVGAAKRNTGNADSDAAAGLNGAGGGG